MRHRSRPLIEGLEDRAVPAVIAWDGGPTGNGTDWLVAANWAGDVLPGTNDDVTLGPTGTNSVIQLRGAASVRSVTNARTVRVVGVVNPDGPANLTAGAGGLANSGVIELTSEGQAWPSELRVSGGALTNAVGGTIRSLPGAGGSRAVRLNNGSVDFVNQGTVAADADLDIVTFGVLTGSSFDSSGTIVVATGCTLRPGTEFNYLGGPVGGGGTLNLVGSTVRLAVGYAIDGAVGVTFQGTTVNGPGTLSLASGVTLTSLGGVVNAPFATAGSLIVRGGTQLNGGATTAAGSTIRVIGNNQGGNLILTVGAGGMTNGGLIELTSEDAVWSPEVRADGTLTNAVLGTIRTLAGTGGARTIRLNNGSVDFVNQGTVAADADLDIITFGGVQTGSSFDSSGTIAVAAGRTLRPGTVFNYLGGTLGGGGTLDLTSRRVNLTQTLTVGPDLPVLFQGTTVNGPGTLAIAAGATVTSRGGVIAAPLELGGTLVVRADTEFHAHVSTAAGSVIRVLGNDQTPQGWVFLITTSAAVLTNRGTIELTNEGAAECMVILQIGGTLTNAAGGTIRALPGVGGGIRGAITYEDAYFINQGTVAADTDFFIDTFWDHTSNAGTFTVAANQTLTTKLANANLSGGTLTGGTYVIAGTYRINSSVAITTLAADLTLTGTDSAVINDQTGANALADLNAITAAGRLTLGGTRNFTAAGPFENAGTLLVNAGSTFTAAAGLTNTGSGSLGGGGTVAANLTSAGTVSPGNSPGLLAINGNTTLGGPLAIELEGVTAGTQYDQLAVSGDVTLGGPLSLSLGFNAPAGSSFRIVDNDGTDAVTGTFSGLAEGSVTAVAGQPFRVSYAGGTGNDVVLTRLPAAHVAGVTANMGQINATQRSRVTTLTVAFDVAVTIVGSVAGAFDLSRIGGSAVGGFTATAALVNGVTVVTLSGFTGAETEFGSLADGRYRLTVRGSQVVGLDGNGDGAPGDDYTLTGTVANGLYRLYADVNGDGTINAADFGPFRGAFGSSVGQSAYLDYLDLNGDGVINAFDFGQFRTRFGSSVP